MHINFNFKLFSIFSGFLSLVLDTKKAFSVTGRDKNFTNNPLKFSA